MDLKEKIRDLITNFGILNDDEIAIVVEKTIVDQFTKGTVLLREGQIPTRCYMLVEGCVREYIVKEGEEKTTAFFTEGDTFSPVASESEPSKYYWECLEDCTLTISNKNFEEEIRLAVPRLEAVIQEMAIKKIDQAREDWSRFVSSSPEERYLDLLHTKPMLLNRVPHHQVASYLGIKPQSLSRIRRRLLDRKV